MTDLTTENNESQHPATAGIGARFKTARQDANLSTKEAATRLRLNEKLILMLENEDFTNNRVPPLFMRGYIRSYAKLLNLSEEADIQRALQYLQEISSQQTSSTTVTLPPQSNAEQTVNFRYSKLFGFLLVVVWVSLTGLWWRDHSTASNPVLTPDNKLPTPNVLVTNKQQPGESTPPTANTTNTVPPAMATATAAPPTTTKTPTTPAPAKEAPRMVQSSEPGLSGTSESDVDMASDSEG